MESHEITWVLLLLVFLTLIVLVFSIVKLWRQRKHIKLLSKKVERQGIKIEELESEYSAYYSRTEPLKKYQEIDDVEAEISQMRVSADKDLLDSEARGKSIIDESLEKASKISMEIELEIQQARESARRIEAEANQKAKEIAGDALEAKKNAENYSATVVAMKNIIGGYGDEYLIPNESVLDELAMEYDHKEAGEELKELRKQAARMIKGNQAAECDYVEKVRRATAIDFVLDAFNGKVDSILAKVKHDNYGKLSQQLKDAYRIVNHNGRPFRDARITQAYFDLIEQQLKMAVAVTEIKR